MSLASALRADYAILEVSRPGPGNLSTKLIEEIDLPWGPARLAVDSEGWRHVLVPVPQDLELQVDRRSSGIRVGPHELIDGEDRRRFLDLCCTKPWLHDVFLPIAEEMLLAIRQAGAHPDTQAIGVLDRWRDLLSRARSEGPSRETLVGLYAELCHLREICRIDARGLASWHGPESAIHDFSTGTTRLEVKASSSRQSWRCTIHGLEQLDAPAGHTLYLSLSQLEIGAPGGETVLDVVDELVTLGLDAAGVYERLSAAGLPPAHLDAAGGLGLRLIDRRVWRVGPDFPRLTTASIAEGRLPAGIAAVHYQLELTALAQAPLSDEHLDALHAALAGAAP